MGRDERPELSTTLPLVERITCPTVEPQADRGIRLHYGIESSAWVWHPGCDEETEVRPPLALQFSLTVSFAETTEAILHISADERFVWSINGHRVAAGPDRSDVDHWSFHTYRTYWPAGRYELEVAVWQLGELSPHAQVSHRGGFIFGADAVEHRKQFGTGHANWCVARATDVEWRQREMKVFFVVGPEGWYDGGLPSTDEPVEAVVVAGPMQSNPNGIMTRHWRLLPSPLPEMMYKPYPLGVVRVAGHDPEHVLTPDRPQRKAAEDLTIVEADLEHAQVAAWAALIDNDSPLVVPARSTSWVIIDLQNYVCGFSSVRLTGSGCLRWEWAESLFMPELDRSPMLKGNRDEVVGKRFAGFGDTFVAGPFRSKFGSHWWRSGRYLRITAKAEERDLIVHRLEVRETRYPLEVAAHWQSDQPQLDAIMPMARRGLEMCLHETYMDCPYYEQMMYVGDGRLEMLLTHVLSPDGRPIRRGIELFDWSRYKTGLVAERYPSSPYQLSPTFSMLWIPMVRDYALYRDDEAWVRERLRGVRSVVDELFSLSAGDGLLEALPGWAFVDWCAGEGWQDGCPPGVVEGEASSIINLQWLMALSHAAEVERWHGEAAFAERLERQAEKLRGLILERFWDDRRQMIADDASHRCFSEHAQVLLLLNDVLPQASAAALFARFSIEKDLAPVSIYFRFYLFEVFHKFGRGDLLVAGLRYWQDLVDMGLRTPVEQPGATRSDCHAWGSHPLFHAHCTLAGVRPGAAGYRSVDISPAPGPLNHLMSETPHPRGRVRLEMTRQPSGTWSAAVSLPADTPGRLRWAGQTHPLAPGAEVVISLDANA